MQSMQLPLSFETRVGTDSKGRQCFIVSFDSQQFESRLSELVSCFTQVSYIPELSIYSVSGHAWHYDIVCSTDNGVTRKDVSIDGLQETLIECIASLSLSKAKARTPAKTKSSSSRRPPARKLKAV